MDIDSESWQQPHCDDGTQNVSGGVSHEPGIQNPGSVVHHKATCEMYRPEMHGVDQKQTNSAMP